MPATKPIAGILFDKDGTASRLREELGAGELRAGADRPPRAMRALRVSSSGGRDGSGDRICRSDSLLRPGIPWRLPPAWSAPAHRFTVEELTALFRRALCTIRALCRAGDRSRILFCRAARERLPARRRPPATTKRSITGNRQTLRFRGLTSITSPATIAAMEQSREPGMVLGVCAANGACTRRGGRSRRQQSRHAYGPQCGRRHDGCRFDRHRIAPVACRVLRPLPRRYYRAGSGAHELIGLPFSPF